MSLLDDNLEQHLSNCIYEPIMSNIIDIMHNHGCRVIIDEYIYNYYSEIYRTDQLLNIMIDDAPYNCTSKSYYYVKNVNSIQNEIIDKELGVITTYLNPIQYHGIFTYLKIFVENDTIIIEPCNKYKPILIKNWYGSINLPEFVFRCSDYKGYILAVDSDFLNVSKLFPNCMIIQEHSIIQQL